MRTRFLGTEFLRSFPIQTLEFFRCSLPHLPPADVSTHEELPYCFDDVPIFNISLQIEKLQIENCLRNFLSGVLPQHLKVGIGDLVDDRPCAATTCINVRSCGIEHAENSETFIAEQMDNLCSITVQLDEKDEKALVVMEKNDFEALHFEISEVDSLSITQDHNFQRQMESMMNLSEIANVHNILDDMSTFELREQDFLEILQSLVSVNNFTVSFIETKTDPTEDSGFTELDSRPATFFLLEVDDASMSIFNDMPIEGVLTALLHTEFEKVTEDDDIVTNEVEFLHLQKCDLPEYLSGPYLEMQGYDIELPASNFFADLSFIDKPEGLHPGKMLLHQQGKSDNISVSLEGILLFEGFQLIDLELCSICEVFFDFATVAKVEACEDMFGEAMKFRSFNELIVCNDLTLADDLFKSLPVPILSDCQILWSLQSFVHESLKDLELEFPSVFDGLYLDWHILEEENGGWSAYSSCWKTLEEKDMSRICTALNSHDHEILILNFVLADDSPDQKNFEEKKEVLHIPLSEQNIEEKKEVLNRPLCDSSVPLISVKEVACNKLLHDNQRERSFGEIETVKVLASSNSMVRGSDDFFFDPQKCMRGLNCKAFELSLDSSKPFSVDCSKDTVAACAETELPLPRWTIKVHRIKLSDEILGILESLRKNFFVMLENDKELKDTLFSSQDLDDFSLLCTPKEKLMNQIEKEFPTGTPLAHGSEKLMLLAALCAIKQMAWYLCYYGFHSSYIYICKLLEGMQCLRYRLKFLQNLTGEMCGKAEKEMVKFHPSLSVVKELLETNVSQSDEKMLIVAEPLFWWPLKILLNSMKISYDEPPNFSTYSHQGNGWIDCADAKNINFQSDCCLVSHEYINALFPFSKFRSILEYGGPCELSRVSKISPELDDFPLLYFLKVELEDSDLARALCHGVEMPKHVGKKDDRHSISIMTKTKNNVIELLNFMPYHNLNMKPIGAVDEDDACSTMQVPYVPLITEFEKIERSKPSTLDTVIVVNTQNLDKEMVISRRSTYQRILAMEKLGVQVVERDLHIPVDILVDAAVCLAWYDLMNIRKKASAPDEAFSCLPLCIENIAASILTSLSFAFSRCILIFEGEKSFIAGVMESSDELYAAAASLGIDLQIFYSYSSDMTDRIILSAIETAAKITEVSYPKMDDSESLAESFLTAFPSINPLSAHAILSSGGTLVEFVGCSHDCRIHAVQKFKIPEEAVSLFTLLTKYGEREDSKSGMTDSSSSVSYAPGIQKFQMKRYSENKRKYEEDLLDVDICGNKTHFELLQLFSNGRSNSSKAARQNDFWKSGDIDAVGEFGMPGLSFDAKLFAQREELDANMIMSTSSDSPVNDAHVVGGPLISKKMKKWDASWKDMVADANETWDRTSMKEMKRLKMTNSWNQMGNLVGEVIDVDDPTSVDISNAYSAKSSACKNGKASSERTRGVARHLFSSSNSLPDFPVSGKRKFDEDSRFYIDNHKKGPATIERSYLDSSFNKYNISSSHGGLSFEDTMHTIASKFRDLPSEEREYLGGTPLWNAVHSNQCIGQSPWTIEFLNRIRAKSKSREHSLPPELSAPCAGCSKNTSKAMKRKSPSILEFYRYQGDRVGKTVQQREKRSLQPQGLSKSKNKTTSADSPPTWTPLDKRAKRTLSFATTGNEAQSKLIWTDRKFQTLSNRVVHQG